jgi:hypothetical protein
MMIVNKNQNKDVIAINKARYRILKETWNRKKM